MIPFITVEQMREVDRLMIEKYGVVVRQMMEIAGYSTAVLARQVLGNVEGKKIICLAGSGNNGGDALAAGRNLMNWGAEVEFFLSKDRLGEEPGRQLQTLENLGATIWREPYLLRKKHADLIIDGVIGYNLKGDPTGKSAELIKEANNHSAPILAIDTPSGFDADGVEHTPCVQATWTIALSLPKVGLKNASAVGELYVGDMMVPRQIFEEIGVEWKPYFKDGMVIRV